MNCWKVLGIDAGADKKTIKLAYARLLKKNRPEDDPQGFTALHNAYKQALTQSKPGSNSKQQPIKPQATNHSPPIEQDTQHSGSDTYTLATAPDTPESSTEPPDSDSVPVVVNVAAPIEKPPPEHDQEKKDENPELENAADYQVALSNDWQQFTARVEKLFATTDQLNNVYEWKFIESIPSMIDLDFRARASNYLFDTVSDANTESLQTNDLRVKSSVLNYLSNFFQWETNWRRLEASHGSQKADAVFHHLNNPQNKIDTQSRPIHYFSRIIAYAIDLLIAGACIYTASEYPQLTLFNYIGAGYLLVVVPLMEASSWQASFGKRMIKLIVVDKSGLRLRWYHSVWRSWVTVACLIGGKIVVWINMFTSYKYNALLQDLISRSHVVEKD